MQALNRLNTPFSVLTSVIMLGTSGFLFWTASSSRGFDRPTIKVPRDPIALTELPWRGSTAANVGIIEYVDFECPFCRRFAKAILPHLESRYLSSGKVMFAVRHLPLSTLHPFARGAAEAAECANDQGRFWPMHDLLMQLDGPLAESGLLDSASRAELNMKDFGACLNRQPNRMIDDDAASAAALGIDSTPVFLVGTISDGKSLVVRRIIQGGSSISEFSDVIDMLLKKD